MRVILVRLSALGDIVHTWPLAAELRRRRPDLQLTWVVEQSLQPLVQGHPALDEVVAVRTHHWRRHPFSATSRREIASLRARFRQLEPDLCIDPQGVLKSAVVTRWTGAARRVGLAVPWRRERLAGLAYTETIPGCSHHPHVVATNLELVRAIDTTPPATPPAPEGEWLLRTLCDHRPPGSWRSPYAVLLPGAGHRSKVLPVRTLADIAGQLVQAGLPVVVVWGPSERERAAAVVDGSDSSGVTLAPSTDLADLAVVLGGAALVIGGDTGPMHLAASLGTATVGVFLTTSRARNGPLGRAVRAIAATSDTGSRPTGSARARQIRSVAAGEIVDTALALIERKPDA